jgi:hypothetical protein
MTNKELTKEFVKTNYEDIKYIMTFPVEVSKELLVSKLDIFLCESNLIKE